jgi:replication-associated recombination protein RarA
MAVHPQHDDVWSRTTTIGGYAADEVRSVLQKSIRRGWVEEAVLAAYELYETGPESEEMLWRRLEIIATEDVGYGLIDAPCLIEALNAQRLRIPPTVDRWIFTVHAVRLLATAKKDRTSTDLAIWAREVVARGERKLEVLDFEVDYHTRRGVAMGRGPQHWLTEGGGQLDNQLDGLETKWGDYVRAGTMAQAQAEHS